MGHTNKVSFIKNVNFCCEIVCELYIQYCKETKLSELCRKVMLISLQIKNTKILLNICLIKKKGV